MVRIPSRALKKRRKDIQKGISFLLFRVQSWTRKFECLRSGRAEPRSTGPRVQAAPRPLFRFENPSKSYRLPWFLADRDNLQGFPFLFLDKAWNHPFSSEWSGTLRPYANGAVDLPMLL